MAICLGDTVLGDILRQHNEYVEIFDNIKEGKKLFEEFEDDHVEFVQWVSNWKNICSISYPLITNRQGITKVVQTIHVKCPYCYRHAKRVKGGTIFPREKFPVQFAKYQTRVYWLCKYCEAYVNCHKAGVGFTGREPMGTLAKKELRTLRHRVHKQFDPLWRSGILGSRSKAYRWLGKQMNLDQIDCHIGLFNERQCERALEIIGSLSANL